MTSESSLFDCDVIHFCIFFQYDIASYERRNIIMKKVQNLCLLALCYLLLCQSICDFNHIDYPIDTCGHIRDEFID